MEGILRTQQEKSVERRFSGGGFASLPDAFHYTLTDDDFARVRGLIYRMAGISLAPGKFDMVYSRLARRLRVRGLESFAQYLRLVELGDEEESEAFINALTTNMTSFFREPHHFRMLAERLAKRGGRPVSIWSCASSSGEEPYSIAMTALEALDDSSGLDILASDIDTAVLAKARQGIYPIDQLAKVPLHLRKRFFMRGEGKNDGFARVKEELRRPVTFRRLNLLDEKWPIHGKFDFVFCRNVMIYFDRETQHAILKRIARVLNPDGLLFVGHSESFHHTQELFKLCGTTAYTLRG
ncbi:CheR family methyltransferase [Citrifermentans bemidjiense]|uniref:CheR family methyltransferase n=1 Tax=Citrifermentans bemidjiense TaxID=225194 RepID=UPI0011D0D3BF|nr:CheR family methyltransferase [Citrifermentans bemidjiense]